MRESWPNGHDSKHLIRWVPSTRREKRERPGKNEEELFPAKRRALQTQIEEEDAHAQSQSLNQGASDAQIPPHISPSEVSLVGTAFNDDELAELTYSNSTPSSDSNNIQSIDDFPTDDLTFSD